MGLRVAAVDGEHDRRGHTATGLSAAARLSASSSLSGCWPTNGCASSAFRTSAGSAVTAARAASRSYAATCCVKAEQLGLERALGQRDEAARVDARRHLDDVVVGEPGERAVVAHVDLVHRVVAADERPDEPGRRLAVEGAAALLEQRGLLVQRRVAIELEQAALDLGDDLGARRSLELLGDDRVVAVEVLEVGGRHDAELLQQALRQRRLLGDRAAVRREQLRKHVAAADVHGADPGQVVEPHLIDDDLLGRDVEVAGEGALEADRDVAEAHRAVSGVEQRARDDPDRVREVDDPGVGRGELADALCDLEHDGHGAERLCEAAGAGRLLADAAAGERDGLVREACGLAADADLHEHEVGAVECAVEVAGDEQLAVEALALEHPRGEPADDLAPVGIDVVQDELPHADPVALA